MAPIVNTEDLLEVLEEYPNLSAKGKKLRCFALFEKGYKPRVIYGLRLVRGLSQSTIREYYRRWRRGET